VGSPNPIIDADDHRGAYWMNDDQYEISPWPARDLIDLESYHYEIDGHKATSLIAQRGCPFRCGFCGGRNSSSLRVSRHGSALNIVSEIEHLYDHYGYTGFMLYDDELNIRADAFMELLGKLTALQKRRGVEFRFRGFVKSELFGPAMAAAMYEAGFRWVL